MVNKNKRHMKGRHFISKSGIQFIYDDENDDLFMSHPEELCIEIYQEIGPIETINSDGITYLSYNELIEKLPEEVVIELKDIKDKIMRFITN